MYWNIKKSKDQAGFIKGRYVGENSGLLHDIMKYCEENNLSGLLMLIDFEKKPLIHCLLTS